MKFDVDGQTLKDLDIFRTAKNSKSLFDMFNFTVSIGGKNKLYDYLSSPLTSVEEIRGRIDAVKFFQEDIVRDNLEVDKNSLDFIEHYLNMGNYPTKPPSRFFAVEKGLLNKLKPNSEYYIIERGVKYVIELMCSMHRFALALMQKECPAVIKENNERIISLFAMKEYAEISSLVSTEKIGAYATAKYDYIFRYTCKEHVLFYLNLIYEYDVFTSLAKAVKLYNLSFPEVSEEKGIEIKGLFHPFIQDPVKNDIKLGADKNLLFVSGPNMAGKSTFLKALGLSVYLAHAGFPVPADAMKFGVLTGLYTTINISDNISSGYSHFYSEVLRIKDISERLKDHNMLVIFDELFRGTNVKDAYDGSLAVISGFSEVRNSFFAISTHIIEVVEKLEDIPTIQFRYMEIVKRGSLPEYTYKLKEGVSDDRLGMHILREERLIEIIKEINN